MSSLRSMGYSVGRKRVLRLMEKMSINAIYPKKYPNTSEPNKEHKVYPYLLRNMEIDRPNQVWQMDITYVPMGKGYMYLSAIIDVYSRYIVGWGLSNTQDKEWVTEVASDAFAKYGKPEIFNTDQGSQFTSDLFTENLIDKGIKVSMDGVGRAKDNIFIERFWRGIKYEKLYLSEHQTGLDLYKNIELYMDDYNAFRPHQGIENNTPEAVYDGKKKIPNFVISRTKQKLIINQ
jgi:putative transposase